MSKFTLSHSTARGERNWFLASLSARDYRYFRPELEELTLVAGQVLYEPGHAISHVYFPEDAIVSVVCCPNVDRALEVAVVGPEGFIGHPVLRGVATSISRFLVQVPGRAKRMRADPLLRAMEQPGAVQRLASRYVQALFDQVMFCAACNVGHSPRERCARWFLMIHDRIAGDEFLITQEFLGYMLGMTRQTVSAVARELQDHGTIEYARGRIRVMDRDALEHLACPCYAAITDRVRELLARGDPKPA